MPTANLEHYALRCKRAPKDDPSDGINPSDDPSTGSI